MICLSLVEVKEEEKNRELGAWSLGGNSGAPTPQFLFLKYMLPSHQAPTLFSLFIYF